ncbi:uncharacterized protein [Leptinotarsa decemlineata]|uniref:uncharacterized protein n=1 Tax=Leptinotarsa decemlineata TaxID=7539 RepID=UPI003D30A305
MTKNFKNEVLMMNENGNVSYLFIKLKHLFMQLQFRKKVSSFPPTDFLESLKSTLGQQEDCSEFLGFLLKTLDFPKMDKTWTVVKFLEENSVEAVPTHWLIGNTHCVWPPYPREKVINSIRTYENMNTCWPSHKVSIFRNGTYNNYLEARNKTKVAEYSSDLNEEDSKSRKYRKKKNKISSSDESEEDETYSKLPPPPSKTRDKDTPPNTDEFESNALSSPMNEAPPKSPGDLANEKELLPLLSNSWESKY